MVLHNGQRADKGHYLTYARHEGASQDWWVYNDRKLREARENKMEMNKEDESYICFYERIKDADVVCTDASGAAVSGRLSERSSSVTALETKDADGAKVSKQESKTSKRASAVEACDKSASSPSSSAPTVEVVQQESRNVDGGQTHSGHD